MVIVPETLSARNAAVAMNFIVLRSMRTNDKPAGNAGVAVTVVSVISTV